MDSTESPSEKWFNMVRDFHELFNHPVARRGTVILSEGDRAGRGAWLLEELMEFIAAESLIDQVDAAIDFLYFCLGNFVAIGVVPAYLDHELPDTDNLCPDAMQFSHRVSFAQRAAESVFEFMHSDTLRGQRDFSGDMGRTMLRCMRVMQVDPRGLFEIIHESNMGKLWPDGKPRYGDFGKVVKPVTWEPPEPEMLKELGRRVKTWEDKYGDDIPF